MPVVGRSGWLGADLLYQWSVVMTAWSGVWQSSTGKRFLPIRAEIKRWCEEISLLILPLAKWAPIPFFNLVVYFGIFMYSRDLKIKGGQKLCIVNVWSKGANFGWDDFFYLKACSTLAITIFHKRCSRARGPFGCKERSRVMCYGWSPWAQSQVLCTFGICGMEVMTWWTDGEIRHTPFLQEGKGHSSV